MQVFNMSIQSSQRFLKSYGVGTTSLLGVNGGTDYVIVYQSGPNTVARADGTGRIFEGIMENNPNNVNDVARVCYGGISKVRAGTGPIIIGDLLTSDARGYAIKKLVTTTSPSIGVAQEANATDGQLIEIRVNPVVGS